MARVIYPSTSLTKEINLPIRILRILSNAFINQITDFLEYRLVGENTVYKLSLVNFRYYLFINLTVNYFKVLNPNTYVYLELEIEDKFLKDLLNLVSPQVNPDISGDIGFDIAGRILGNLSVLDIQEINIPAGGVVSITLKTATRCVQIFEDGLANFISIGKVWLRYFDTVANAERKIPVNPNIIYPIGKDFQLVNTDTVAKLVRILEMG
jgi:2,4-dienoyl-CoA reductase-like NADH-dependent reductase (Old Yellow Enzyme family)